MPSSTTDISSFISLISWNCLNTESYINPIFTTALPNREKFDAAYALAGFTYCSGLLAALQAPAPPTIGWLESLSTNVPLDVWGIYVLVLKKPGSPTLIYIGSGTACKRGVRARLSEHQRRQVVPKLLDEAENSGYKIVHMALLGHCPMPAPGDVPVVRTLTLVIEAAFSCIFWAMPSREKNYGFARFCPWSRRAFSWSGLCSHSALKESLHQSTFQFTPAERERMAEATKAKDQAYGLEYARNLRANPTQAYRDTQNRNNEKQKPATKARQQAAIADKTYYCAACDVACRDNASLELHNTKPRHFKKLAMGNSDYKCTACNLSFKYLSAFKVHEKSTNHANNMARSGSRST